MRTIETKHTNQDLLDQMTLRSTSSEAVMLKEAQEMRSKTNWSKRISDIKTSSTKESSKL